MISLESINEKPSVPGELAHPCIFNHPIPLNTLLKVPIARLLLLLIPLFVLNLHFCHIVNTLLDFYGSRCELASSKLFALNPLR